MGVSIWGRGESKCKGPAASMCRAFPGAAEKPCDRNGGRKAECDEKQDERGEGGKR